MPGRAAPAEDVAEAAGQRAQLAAQRRSLPAPGVVAAGWRVRGRGRRGRVGAGARRPASGDGRARRRLRTGSGCLTSLACMRRPRSGCLTSRARAPALVGLSDVAGPCAPASVGLSDVAGPCAPALVGLSDVAGPCAPALSDCLTSRARVRRPRSDRPLRRRCAIRRAAVPATPARRRSPPAPRRRARPAPAPHGARSCWPPRRTARWSVSLGSEVERGDRRSLASAGAHAPPGAALQARADGAGEDLRVADARGRRPAAPAAIRGSTSTSSSTNTTSSAMGVGDAGVAGGVQPERVARGRGRWRRSARRARGSSGRAGRPRPPAARPRRRAAWGAIEASATLR